LLVGVERLELEVGTALLRKTPRIALILERPVTAMIRLA
jgi:hypothetical protein